MKANIIEDIEQIKKKLLKMPDEKVEEIGDFVEFVYSKLYLKKGKKIEKLEGIWEGLGFDKISDIEQEIADIRQGTESRIAKRNL